MKEQDPQFLEFAGHAKAISDAALHLRKAWPSASHYQGMKASVAYLLKALVPLRGCRATAARAGRPRTARRGAGAASSRCAGISAGVGSWGLGVGERNGAPPRISGRRAAGGGARDFSLHESMRSK
jgi:hypothetical protein